MSHLPPPVWFARDARDHRPRLLAHASTPHAWPSGTGWARWSDGVVWIDVADRVVAIPCQAPLRVSACGAWSVVRDAEGHTTLAGPDRVERVLDPATHAGRDASTRRASGRWTSPLPLPDGARRARRIVPFATGRGAAWADGGFLYRQHGDGPPRPLGPAGRSDDLLVGPEGSLLVGDGASWSAGATPRGLLVALTTPLRADGPVRFAADGDTVAGMSGEDGVIVDLRDGSVRSPCDPHPADARGHALPWRPGRPPVVHLGRVAGPAGRILSAHDGALLGELPAGEGPVAPCGPGWVAADGVRLVWTTEDGSPLGEALLEEEPVRGWADGEHAALLLLDGSTVRVSADGDVFPAPELAPPRGDRPDPALRALGFEHAAALDGRTLVCAASGLVAAV